MKFLFWFGVLFTLFAPIALGLFQYVETAWVAAVCGAFITIIAKLPELTELSFGPVRAKMRETIAEANATVEQLRAVAASMAKVSATGLIADSFMAESPFLIRIRLYEEVMRALDVVGVDESQKREVADFWGHGVSMIYCRKLIQSVAEEVPRDAYENLQPSMRSWVDRLNWRGAPPDQIRAFLEEHDLMNAEREEWLQDYQHFLETGVIRREQLWESE